MDLGHSRVLAIVSNVTMTSFYDSDFVSFRYILRSGITGSYGTSVLNLLRKLHIVFHNGFTSWHSLQQCTRVSFFPPTFLSALKSFLMIRSDQISGSVVSNSSDISL